MKKIFAGILAIIMILSMLGGCSSGDEIETSVDKEVIAVATDEITYAEPTETAVTIETEEEIQEQETIIEETAPAPIETSKTLVYTTPQGEKYHKATCRWVKDKETEEWTIEEAIAAGYDACGTCKPR